MGSIAKRKNGSWLARYRDETGRQHSKTFKLKRDADTWLAEQANAMSTGQWVNPRAGRITFAEFYRSWSVMQVSWAPRTRVAMDFAAGRVPFADLPLGRLRRSHVEAWVASMHHDGLAASTIKLRVANVRSVLRAAVRDRIIASDPGEGVALPRVRRASNAMRLPSPAEVGAILDAAGDFRGFVAVCSYAGLRLGEAAGLQGRDVDFMRRQLEIRRQVLRIPGDDVAVTGPKDGSERVVPVPDALLLELGRYATPRSDQWLFVRPDGRPYNDNAAGHRFRSICRAAGVTGVRLHDLRHFYASGLIAAGCDVVTVQKALGHHAASVTLNVYSHLWPNGDDRARQAAQSLAEQIDRAVAADSRALFVHREGPASS